MATSSNIPPSKKMAAMPSGSELVAFDHSAAGHEGISSNASGSLIIKPCTQAEIDFYESAKDHPLFQAHMPTFIGSLCQNEDQDAVKPLLEAAQPQVQFLQDHASSAGTTAVGKGSEDTGNAVIADSTVTPELVKRASWKPSGGKKISTGLAIVLENVAGGFKRPNVLDVKLGARLWDDDAPLAKRRRLDEVAERTTSGNLGFRVAGMKMWCPPALEDDERSTNTAAAADKKRTAGNGDVQNGGDESDEANVGWKNGYKSYNKLYGQSFSKDNVVDALTTYLGGVGSDDHQPGKTVFKRKRAALIAKRLIRELESIQYALENEESRMYSASVLMVYEGDEEAMEVGLQNEEEEDKRERERQKNGEVETADEDEDDEEDDEDEEIPQKVLEVRLIDFAHASWTPGQGPDENALMGVRSLLRLLKGLVE
ncbi:hypothetical protein A1O1_08969 [Capronia coronata CBS 617.96]|uniref:Kinase n=1 Tax=Capronia coronata CBS 617.96 TaxID=1182541 RepID=W9XEE3_9EURO|nr:uncharacterized protein A1O1_08969 [Capronia coronata CBS 617.96]EXJ78568.1 hypothetical protein A1O1_08969 [Capronia coronata CBS 617.96]